MAERHAAIHAAGALLLQLVVAAVFVEFQPVANAHLRRSSQRQLARIFQESCRLTHYSALPEASVYCLPFPLRYRRLRERTRRRVRSPGYQTFLSCVDHSAKAFQRARSERRQIARLPEYDLVYRFKTSCPYYGVPPRSRNGLANRHQEG